ncbi:unnamed protein product [Pleuronectes platessa]|uniref:Uncharacterized protein n=1 Tax=Pleuronectes platessa TaxID=8262 RepID=A0A9N7UKD0_PLEPL|nr:unnamed protein product [Pleuronectes platessa]
MSSCGFSHCCLFELISRRPSVQSLMPVPRTDGGKTGPASLRPPPAGGNGAEQANAEQRDTGGEKETGREGGYAAAGLSCVICHFIHPKFSRGQTRALAALRLATVF